MGVTVGVTDSIAAAVAAFEILLSAFFLAAPIIMFMMCVRCISLSYRSCLLVLEASAYKDHEATLLACV